MSPLDVRRRWAALPTRWRRAIVAALALRAGLAVLSVVVAGLLPGLDPVGVAAQPGFAGWDAAAPADVGWGLLGASLERFDALWYLAIAVDGYPTTEAVPQAAAFLPGLPLLVAAVDLLLPGGAWLAGSVVALLATVAALAGVHALVEATAPGDAAAVDDRARRAVLLLAVFPVSFFLVAPFSESLFLAASVWALVHVERRRWWAVAVLGVVAGATRALGVLLALPVALRVLQRDRTDVRTALAGLVAGAGGPVGLGLVLLHGGLVWGAWLAPWQVQGGWQRTLAWPWDTLADAFRFALATPGAYATGYHTLDLVVFVPVVAATVWLCVRGPRHLGVYAASHVLVWLVTPFPPRPLMSTPRFALAVAPLALAWAAWTSTRARETAWVAASGALLGVGTTLVVGWYFLF
ncbi:MAG: hypothetical protein ACLGIR_13800 [Actinomycetes bacterium]